VLTTALTPFVWHDINSRMTDFLCRVENVSETIRLVQGCLVYHADGCRSVAIKSAWRVRKRVDTVRMTFAPW
jgi:hypothetical protein